MRVYTIQTASVVHQLRTQPIVYSRYHKALFQQRYFEMFKQPYQYIYDKYREQKKYSFGPDEGLFWAYDQFKLFADGYYRMITNKRSSNSLLTLDLPEDLSLAFNSTAWNMCVIRFNLLYSNKDKLMGYDWDLMFDPEAPTIMAADYRRRYPEKTTMSDEQIVGATREVVFPYIQADWIQGAKHFRGKANRIN